MGRLSGFNSNSLLLTASKSNFSPIRLYTCEDENRMKNHRNPALQTHDLVALCLSTHRALPYGKDRPLSDVATFEAYMSATC
ncbi:hypothetical protein AVEN_64144-1 [Araneus ventricosus]|uniref:Uncharacterized protein n=1 Tax=Araneus ventricosus TaxID=182803 RepID=A0A4Y2C5V1_ARAVE|nr:hypothetical protein AVEN_64144-1 [Araneus ventricosus]